MYDVDWAVVVPLANEEETFSIFIEQLSFALHRIRSGKVYLVVDRVSQDKTLELCRDTSSKDSRFITVWAPDNKNIVDAYIAGYRAAYENNHSIIIEMDAGMSHDPRALPMFLRVLNEGNECAFGSRFINGGSMVDSPFKRRFLSKSGTTLANLLLGTKMYDMTSGFQGFHRNIVKLLIDYPLHSKAHFYQTEIRYLLRKTRYAEIPIHYQSPSPGVSKNAITNSFAVLFYYFRLRLLNKSVHLS